MMARKNWQRVGSATGKTHYKLYKAGKLWLTSGITTLALFGGLLTTSVVGQAATGDQSDAEKTGEISSSAASSAVEVALPQSSATPSSGSSVASSAASSSASSAAPAASSAGSQADSSAQPAASSVANLVSSAATPVPSSASSVANSAGAANSLADSQGTSEAGSSAAPAGSKVAGLAASSFAISSRMAAPAAAVLPTDTVVGDTSVADDDSMTTSGDTIASNGDVITDGSTITPPDTGQASLGEYEYSNFYVQTSSKYVLYNAAADVTVYPYNTKTLGTRLGGQLWGFYLILPKSITSSLDNAQTSADNFIQTVSGDGKFSQYFNDFTTLTAYRLNDTTDGRQVYYFRPNDGATSLAYNTGVTATWPAFKMMIYTGNKGDEGTTAPIDINAVTYQELSTAGVLFAGVGDLTNFKTTSTGYPTITTARLGIDAPDANIAGLIMPSHQADRGKTSALPQLSYVDVLVNDMYTVIDGSTGQTLSVKPIVVQGDSTDTYQRSQKLTFQMIADQLGLDASKYSDDLSYSSGMATDTLGWHPNVADLTAAGLQTATTTGVTGTAYTVYLNEKNQASQAEISVTNKSIPTGSTWTPATNLVTATDVDGTAVDPSKITVSITNLDDPTITAVDTTQPGNYALVYKFTDQEGTKHQATTTLFVIDSPISVTANDTEIYAGKNGWQAADNFTGTDANGSPLTIDQSGVSDVKRVNSDGTTTNATLDDLSQVGTYQITYTYTSGAISASAVATVTVNANQAAITYTPTSTTLTVGDTWTPDSVVATDVNGEPVTNVTITIKNAKGDTVTPGTMTSTPGTYSVVYSFTDSQGVVQSTDKGMVTVKPKETTNGTTNPGTSTGGTDQTTPDNSGETTTTSKPSQVTKPVTPTKPTTPKAGADLPASQKTGHSPAVTSVKVTAAVKRATSIQGTTSAKLSLSNGGDAGTITANHRQAPTQMQSSSSTQVGFNGASATAKVSRQAAGQNNVTTTQSATTLPQTSGANDSWLSVIGALSLTLLGLSAGLEGRRRKN